LGLLSDATPDLGIYIAMSNLDRSLSGGISLQVRRSPYRPGCTRILSLTSTPSYGKKFVHR
jgi:hypothetical protein